jgi:hypothetical protein
MNRHEQQCATRPQERREMLDSLHVIEVQEGIRRNDEIERTRKDQANEITDDKCEIRKPSATFKDRRFGYVRRPNTPELS